MAADPAVVGVGDELTVTGTGFPPSSEVTVTYVDADGVTAATQLTITSDTGELTDVLVVPTGTALGELVVTATAGATSATTSVEVVETDDGDVEGGDTGGGGADAGDTDAGDSDAGDPTGGDPTGGDSDGEDPSGADSDGAADSDGSDTDGEPGDLEPAVVADPGVVGVGDALTVTGTGFPPSSEVTVGYVDDEGTTVATHRVTTDETGAFTDVTGDPDGGDADGGDTGPDGGDTSGGDTDGSEGPGDADPSLEVDPGTVRPGEQLATSGSGFPPSTEVTVTYVDSSGRTIATSTVTTDETGAFTDTITVPARTPAGPLTIIATAGERTASATARVIRLGICLDHPARQRGEVQVGRGTGYAPGTVVHAFMSSAPVVDLGTRVADADGEVTFTWTVPASAGLGTHTFSLTAEGYPDQAATFEVVGAPAAPCAGFSDRTRRADRHPAADRAGRSRWHRVRRDARRCGGSAPARRRPRPAHGTGSSGVVAVLSFATGRRHALDGGDVGLNTASGSLLTARRRSHAAAGDDRTTHAPKAGEKP